MTRDATLQEFRPVRSSEGVPAADTPDGDEPESQEPDAPERRDLPHDPSGCLVGTCTEERHPTLQGRIRVRWSELGEVEREVWLPTLQSLAIRQGDRVLIQHPRNWPEPVVTGVVDGFATRPEVEAREAAHLELKADEAVELRGPDGTPLLELRPGPAGPVLRILGDDLDVDMPGRLRLRAGNLQFVARKGSVRIQASDDVVVEGEVIKLN